MTSAKPSTAAKKSSDFRRVDSAVLRIVAVYAVFSALWILLSDQAVTLFTHDPDTITRISIYKGWLFVAVTSGLLAAMVYRNLQRLDAIAKRLAMREHYLTNVINTAGDPIFVKDDQSVILLANDAFCTLFGVTREDVIGKTLAEHVPPDERESFLRIDRQVLTDGRESSVEETLTYQGHNTRTLLTRKTRYTDDTGRHFLVGVIRDITDRKQAEKKLQQAANVFTHAREGIVITDAQGNIVDVNETFTHITGYPRDEVLGRNPRILQSGRQPPEFYAGMWLALSGEGYWSGEIWNRRKDGEVFAELLTISAVRDADGTTQNYVALFSDITPMKEHQQQLERIAHFDALTNLPNRVLLADRLQQAMLHSQRRNQMLAVAYLDLDGFKAVNDTHGHAMGDEMLVVLSRHLKAALREGDTLARIGGDEFVAVLVDLETVADCEPVIARLLQACAQPIQVGHTALQVSASIGVALYPQGAADSDLLLRQADQAMYLAKQAGKNRFYVFDTDQAAAVQSQHESIENIRRAMDRQEFVLHYQPKVDMKSGAVVGAEALIRWQHPQLGLLPPARFLPVIEDHSVGIALGTWVINSALAQISAWRAIGLDLTVSVNVSAIQLQQNDFVAVLKHALAGQPEVPAKLLELEILETSALKDLAQIASVMQACVALGVRFALDDFGTGYSSLTYLRRLPAATLKIDQSFVRDMLADTDDLAIVQGVISLARVFGREVVAEGVETAAHGGMLLSLNCALAQGYGIAKPMPAADFPAWADGWRLSPTWTA